MTEPFLAELRLMSFVFPPKGWAQCNGQLMPINQNQALFALLGTTFGGDGRVNFALPDLRGRVPMHAGGGHMLGERGGQQTHTLSTAELPTHTHVVSAAAAAADVRSPDAAWLAGAPDSWAEPAGGDLAALAAGTVQSTGGSQAHLNMQPYLTLSWCIALQGVFPDRN